MGLDQWAFRPDVAAGGVVTAPGQDAFSPARGKGAGSSEPLTGPVASVPPVARQRDPSKLVALSTRGVPQPRAGRAPNVATEPLRVSDASLAAAAPTNPAAFAAIYRRYGDALHDFCLGMLRDPDAAADCVQDVFCTAATRLGQLREHDKLRPWLYAIARREALSRLRRRRHEEVSDELPDNPSGEDGPDTLASRRELAALVAQAAGGLGHRDRTVLELHYRHELDGPELAAALGVSATNANTLVSRLRTTVERCLGALLVARHQAESCPELAAVLKDWAGGTMTVLLRKRVNRHIEGCPACAQARRGLVTPQALLRSAPVIIPAPAWLGETVTREATPLLHAAGTGQGAWWPAGIGHGTPALVAIATPLVTAATASLVAIAPLGPAPSDSGTVSVAGTPVTTSAVAVVPSTSLVRPSSTTPPVRRSTTAADAEEPTAGAPVGPAARATPPVPPGGGDPGGDGGDPGADPGGGGADPGGEADPGGGGGDPGGGGEGPDPGGGPFG